MFAEEEDIALEKIYRDFVKDCTVIEYPEKHKKHKFLVKTPDYYVERGVFKNVNLNFRIKKGRWVPKHRGWGFDYNPSDVVRRFMGIEKKVKKNKLPDVNETIFRKMISMSYFEKYDKILFPFNTRKEYYDILYSIEKDLDITVLETEPEEVKKLEDKFINVIESTFEKIGVAPYYPVVICMLPKNKQNSDYIEKTTLCVKPGGSAVFLLKRELLDDETSRSFLNHLKISIEFLSSFEAGTEDYMIGFFQKKEF